MQIPDEVKQLCQQYLENVRQDPQHDLKPAQRKLLYDAFDRSIEASLWERIQLEMETVRVNPDLNNVQKALHRETIYNAIAPTKNPTIESTLENEINQARKDPDFHKLLSQNLSNIPDYYTLLAELDPIRYRVAAYLGIVTCRHLIPIWKELLEASKASNALYKEELFPEFYSWVEQYADSNSRSALLDILNQFPQDKHRMRQKIKLLKPPLVNRQWKEATLHLLEDNEFEARVIAFLAQGEEAPWVEATRSVSTYDLPDFMLFVAEKVLDGVVSHKAARQVVDISGTILGNIPEIYELSPLTYSLGEAFSAALGQTIVGLQVFKQNINQNPNIANKEGIGDVASAAATAYSDVYEDFEWVEVDLPKRLEFWEWWLSDAITQAWELV